MKNNNNCTKSYRIRIIGKRRRFRTSEAFGNLNLSEPSRSGFSHCHKQQGALAKTYLQNAAHFCYFILIPSPTCRLRACLNCSRYKPTQGHSCHACRKIRLTNTQPKSSKILCCFITSKNICVHITHCSTIDDSQADVTFLLCIETHSSVVFLYHNNH